MSQTAMRRKNVGLMKRAQRRMCGNRQKRPEVVDVHNITFENTLLDVEKESRWNENPVPVSQMIGQISVVADSNSIETIFMDARNDIAGNSGPSSRIRGQHIDCMA